MRSLDIIDCYYFLHEGIGHNHRHHWAGNPLYYFLLQVCWADVDLLHRNRRTSRKRKTLADRHPNYIIVWREVRAMSYC